jgi:LAO/AO transport system kinase
LSAEPRLVARRRVLSADEYVEGILQGEKSVLARAITLVESSRQDDHQLAQEVLQRLLPHSGRSVRVGVSGVPGVGKSTFIENFGMLLVGEGKRVAVLAVDPTSGRTGGSILGDKTRMSRLSLEKKAFVRPSPTAGNLGGVARATRESMLLCEAAGYDVTLVETVGVGQSETTVAGMVDFFLVLMLATAGDELQGIKRGILELADAIALNKSDEHSPEQTRRALGDYGNALHIVKPASERERTLVTACSGRTGEGLSELWQWFCKRMQADTSSGAFASKRAGQNVAWMWSMVEHELWARLATHPKVEAIREPLEELVREGGLTPGMASLKILDAFFQAKDAQ